MQRPQRSAAAASIPYRRLNRARRRDFVVQTAVDLQVDQTGGGCCTALITGRIAAARSRGVGQGREVAAGEGAGRGSSGSNAAARPAAASTNARLRVRSAICVGLVEVIAEEGESSREYCGELVSADDHEVAVEDEESGRVTVPYAGIRKANLDPVLDFGR